MPSTSDKQRRFMAAAANNPKFAKKAGIKSSVAKEFHSADKKGYQGGGLASVAKNYFSRTPDSSKPLIQRPGAMMNRMMQRPPQGGGLAQAGKPMPPRNFGGRGMPPRGMPPQGQQRMPPGKFPPGGGPMVPPQMPPGFPGGMMTHQGPGAGLAGPGGPNPALMHQLQQGQGQAQGMNPQQQLQQQQLQQQFNQMRPPGGGGMPPGGGGLAQMMQQAQGQQAGMMPPGGPRPPMPPQRGYPGMSPGGGGRMPLRGPQRPGGAFRGAPGRLPPGIPQKGPYGGPQAGSADMGARLQQMRQGLGQRQQMGFAGGGRISKKSNA